MQNFSVAEKTVSIQNKQTNKQKTRSKLNIPHTTAWWDKNVKHEHQKYEEDSRVTHWPIGSVLKSGLSLSHEQNSAVI